uniref:Uncharacterized protein n=1 Tax=Chromera velia CCMP2878 TaxID=1169474 RepID=A0A0G4HXF6_9ALVE|eukprot:Cvel_9243.t1-p1 / transcript=Cvel_9243.t1 / gene=Cvel_9243 / organism=Chromera_velia_CCMP2878 / gene_product=hypothetical protein / transcript_product=hypothetical protein / location=Cvel_scaffold528:6706-24193(-) / protein_length=196 / sequence_SO=supercontig / SO=protein_coding / is_pseudo=false
MISVLKDSAVDGDLEGCDLLELVYAFIIQKKRVEALYLQQEKEGEGGKGMGGCQECTFGALEETAVTTVAGLPRVGTKWSLQVLVDGDLGTPAERPLWVQGNLSTPVSWIGYGRNVVAVPVLPGWQWDRPDAPRRVLLTGPGARPRSTSRVLWVSPLPLAAWELMGALDGGLGGASGLCAYICVELDGMLAGVSLR